MIQVTKAFLPPVEEYKKYIDGIWERVHLTNHGPVVLELEQRLRSYLGVKYFNFLSNGTIAIQLAIKALDLKGEIITTPFSYVATTSSLVWENIEPVFADIHPENFTIDPSRIEDAITSKTCAILATHVYGVPCDVDAIAALAKKHNLKVIYDAAHAFGVQYKGKSLLEYGDISTLSFHATKLFHTVEGGGVITSDSELAHRLSYMRNFGHNGQEEFWGIGINGKNSEFHAAMGLSIFPYIGEIITRRKVLSEIYEQCLAESSARLQRPKIPVDVKYNFAYYPVIFESENQLLKVRDTLNEAGIFPRRYFYPTLDKLPYVKGNLKMEIAESISTRVLCLPLYHDLKQTEVEHICAIINKTLTTPTK